MVWVDRWHVDVLLDGFREYERALEKESRDQTRMPWSGKAKHGRRQLEGTSCTIVHNVAADRQSQRHNSQDDNATDVLTGGNIDT